MSLIPASWMPHVHMDRIIVHWTAGGYEVSDLDREHYHVIIDGDGRPVRGDMPISSNAAPIRSDYAAHTLNCNGGSIGISVACMAGAVEQPFSPGRAPMKRGQWDALVQAVADLCQGYSIPVTPRTVLSHAEVQETLGVRQRGKWDISRLAFAPSIIGAKACGDRLRAEVSAVLDGVSAPSKPVAGIPTTPARTLSLGMSGDDVREWQTELQREGRAVKVDGEYGPMTEGATRTVQARLGIGIDGRVGPLTRAALLARRQRQAETA